jgi:hypothetical protein
METPRYSLPIILGSITGKLSIIKWKHVLDVAPPIIVGVFCMQIILLPSLNKLWFLFLLLFINIMTIKKIYSHIRMRVFIGNKYIEFLHPYLEYRVEKWRKKYATELDKLLEELHHSNFSYCLLSKGNHHEERKKVFAMLLMIDGYADESHGKRGERILIYTITEKGRLFFKDGGYAQHKQNKKDDE